MNAIQESGMTDQLPVLFVDANVLIEAVFFPKSAAAIICDLVASGTFDMATCSMVAEDAERAMLNKITNSTELEIIVQRWTSLKKLLRLQISPDPSLDTVKEVYDRYIGLMRHKADIPVLASAINYSPALYVILSNNREHFNDLVSARCGIKILACAEFLEMLATKSGG